MATTITWAYTLIGYYMMLFIVITLFSMAGAFEGNQIIATHQMSTQLTSSMNQSQIPGQETEIFGNPVKDLFSFFVWNISIYDGSELMNWLWIIRIIFVYIPGLMLTVLLYFAFRSGSA